MNDLIDNKSWWKRNWKWFTVLTTVFLMIGFIIFSFIGEHIGDFAKAIVDPSICKNAVDIANKNDDVQQILGTLAPINTLTIIEGEVIYTENNSTVAISTRIVGAKGKGRMDIIANRNGEDWVYKIIKIRIKKPKQTIHILQ